MLNSVVQSVFPNSIIFGGVLPPFRFFSESLTFAERAAPFAERAAPFTERAAPFTERAPYYTVLKGQRLLVK